MKVLATAIATIGATVGAGVAVAGGEFGTIVVDQKSGKPLFTPLVNVNREPDDGSLTIDGWPAKWIKLGDGETWAPVPGVIFSPESIHINSTLMKLEDIKGLVEPD